MKRLLPLLMSLCLAPTSLCGQATRTLNVLYPSTDTHLQAYQDAQTYLATNNPAVTGVVFHVDWNTVDDGTGAYHFQSVDDEMAPWIAAGKKVALVLWAVSDGATNTATPPYVWTGLGTSNAVTCSGEQIPNYRSTYFKTQYKAVINALLSYYSTNSNIEYIRVGLGHGGETIPVGGWSDTTTTCGTTFLSWGYSIGTWESYLNEMLPYEAGLGYNRQLMVGITPMGSPSTTVPDYIVSKAVPLGIGFGSQGLESSDLANCSSTTADWCTLFQNNVSSGVPLELQTIGQSCPAGTTCVDNNSTLTGPLPPLLTFATSHNAEILEIYVNDWFIAFNPTDYNASYSDAYKQALNDAAAIVWIPAITTQPSNATVVLPATATFTAAASGTAPTYQWYKNGVAISGATSTSYTTPATSAGDNGSQYAMTASNVRGTVTTTAAVLTVLVPPAITTQPAPITVHVTHTATFSVVATGTAPLTYQWYKNGTAISGATSASYTTPNTTWADNNALFSVTVSNSAGNVTSSTAKLTIIS